MTMVEATKTKPVPVGDALLLVLLGLVLYVVTLAPTVLWGDSGHFQLSAVEGRLQASAGSHPLWVWIAHRFVAIPLGEVAGRANGVSAVFGAATLGLLYLLLREVGLGRGAGVLAVLAFAVSHTFWSYAVRAEVYTLTLALMALQAWSGLRWFHTGRAGYLVTAGLAVGLGLAAHLVVVLYVPALLWLAWRGRRRLGWGAGLAFGLALAGGAVPLVLLLVRDARVLGMGAGEALRWALFSFDGYDFGGAMLDYRWDLLPSDLFQWLAFLGIQFVGLAGLCGLVGAVRVWREAGRDLSVFVLLLYLGTMLFAFAYRVGDRYVFYLPGYLPFAIWVGFGLRWVGERLRYGQVGRARRWVCGVALVVLLVGVPLAAYRVAPELASRGVTFRESWHVPGPRGEGFFLWPPKAGYDDARVYAESVLAALPADAVLLAEPNLATPVAFVQAVEGVRTDVTVRTCCWDAEEALAESVGRPVALAVLSPAALAEGVVLDRCETRAAGPVRLLVEVCDAP